MGRVLEQSGATFTPASRMGDTSHVKDFFSNFDPYPTPGVSLLPGDKWYFNGPVGSGPTQPVIPSQQGALPIGTANYAIPGSGTVIYVDPAAGSDANAGTAGAPFRSFAAALTSIPSGTIILRAGTYHENVLVNVNVGPYRVQAYPGEAVWFDGSSIVPTGSWTASGGLWWTPLLYSTDHSQGSDQAADLDSSFPNGFYPDGCFRDGVRLSITNSATPTSGQVFFDYTNNRAWIADNPSGHEMRLSDLLQAITCGGQMSIYGVGFRRYATSIYGLGAVRFAGSSSHGPIYGNNTVENCIFTDNGGTGCSFGASGSTANFCTTSFNRGNGFSAYVSASDLPLGGVGLNITNCYIGFNNQARLSPLASSTAGVKIAQFSQVLVSNCLFDQNLQCNGFWSDYNSFLMVLVNNTFTPGVASPSAGASHSAICHELSDSSLVANNVMNGAVNGQYKWVFQLNNTGRTKVYNNIITGGSVAQLYILMDHRRNATAPPVGTQRNVSQDPWITQSVEFCNNVIGQGNNPVFVRDQNDGDSPIYTGSMMISKLQGNNIIPGSASPQVIAWGNGTGSNTNNYNSAFAFAAANAGYGPNNDNSTSIANCVPLPSDVAAAIGQPTGTVHLGTF